MYLAPFVHHNYRLYNVRMTYIYVYMYFFFVEELIKQQGLGFLNARAFEEPLALRIRLFIIESKLRMSHSEY